MIQPPAALRIARMVCALMAACSLAFFTNCAPAQAQDLVITYRCDQANSSPSPNQNTCWSVFKKAPGRTPTHDRVAVSVANCKTSLFCWTNNTTVANKCKVIPANGPVPPTPDLQNCPA